MKLRMALESDAYTLALMNKMLIEDEGHRNPMSVDDLGERMRQWLEREYAAYLFVVNGETVGYCLYKDEPDYVHIRQFFIARDKRRHGYGKRALYRLANDVWPPGKRLRLDVLVSNTTGTQFWRTCGFADYCLTLERENRQSR